MLAPTLDGNPPSTAPLARVRARNTAIDGTLLFAALAVAGFFFFQGGLEALAGAAIGASVGAPTAYWRNARRAGASSGAFAGLFAGALFAGFFHSAVAAVFFSLL